MTDVAVAGTLTIGGGQKRARLRFQSLGRLSYADWTRRRVFARCKAHSKSRTLTRTVGPSGFFSMISRVWLLGAVDQLFSFATAPRSIRALTDTGRTSGDGFIELARSARIGKTLYIAPRCAPRCKRRFHRSTRSEPSFSISRR